MTHHTKPILMLISNLQAADLRTDVTRYDRQLDDSLQYANAAEMMQAARDAMPPMAGLQSGDVLDRWIYRQPLIDRILFRAVGIAAVLGGVMLMGIGLLGWMQ